MSIPKKIEQPELGTEIVASTPLVPVALNGMDPLMKLAAAGVSIEAIKELVTLYREERAHHAEMDFNDAFADFQLACPPIRHDAEADFATKAGSRMKYSYATLSQIAREIAPLLHERGFSYSWEVNSDGKMLTATCTVRHRGGHARSATFGAPISTSSVQSEAQGAKAAQTFAQRCSLISALGLTTTDTDDDARMEPSEAITEKQVHDLEALITEVSANRDKLLALFGVKELSALAASNYRPMVRMLESKRKDG